MLKFHIYEGTEDNRDESDRFDTKREAIERAKIAMQNARDMGLENYVAHVINSDTGEFVFTESYDLNEKRAIKAMFAKADKAAAAFHRKTGNFDRLNYLMSGEQNAQQTCAEGRFKDDSFAYWECAKGSLESLLCDYGVKETDRNFFRKFGFVI